MDLTTATPEDLKRLYDLIALEMNDDRFFTTKELALLPKIMTPDEWLYAFSSGYMDNSTWLIVLTSKRVIFLNKNLLWGHEETSVGLGKINSVQKKTGIMFGNIVIHDGNREYQIRNVWKKTVIPFTNRLERAIEEFERAARSGIPLPRPTYPWDAPPAHEPVQTPPAAPVPSPVRDEPVVHPDTSIEYPPAPVSGPLRAYMDSIPDQASPPPQPYPPPASAPAPAPAPAQSHTPAGQSNHRHDDPVALRARLDRLHSAGAISSDEHARQMRSIS